MPLVFSTEVDRGCPHDCGLCPEHQQHTCLGIIEVNSACTRYPLSWHRSCSTYCRSKSRPHWLRVSSPRATIEARAMVTPRLHPMQVQGRTVHQIGLPIHFGYAGEVAGSAANELIAILTDPNVKIHEAKAFACKVEKGRLEHPSDIPSAVVHPRPRPEPMPGTDRQAQPEGRTA
jgi:hypothetical protein